MKTISRYWHLLIFIIIINQLPARAQQLTDIQLANQYYQDGEIDKAISLYESLAKHPRNIPQIHNSYFKILLNTGRIEEAEKYIDKVLKHFEGNPYYLIDKGLIYVQRREDEKADEYYTDLLRDFGDDEIQLRIAAQHFTRHQLYEYSLEAYRLARKRMKDPHAYALQLANLYRIMNKKQAMIEEYLNFAEGQPSQLNSVRNILQNVLEDAKDLDAFESMMVEKVQESPNNENYAEMLIWVNLQQKDFYAAFIQARALDKRHKLGGLGIIDIGRIALENEDYRNAIRMFEYVIEAYPNTHTYQIARRYVVKAKEEKVKTTYPVNIDDIKSLISEYELLVQEIGLNQYTAEALRSKALLHAFYLNEYQKAIDILQKIIHQPGMDKAIADMSKLDLGDIYILTGQPWESTLLYSQVEKSSNETTIGYEAKFKNAKLSYYKGDFALAQEHLDILKNATTREIANDAMKLSLLIKDNTVLDTSDVNMQRYAYIDLLLFQNKKSEAMDSLQSLKADLKSHSLYDEILFQEAVLNQELGNFDASLSLLNEIIKGFSYDILGDDALYLKGRILQESKKDAPAAIQVYTEFLKKYPGSIFNAAARRRLRLLRGDFNN